MIVLEDQVKLKIQFAINEYFKMKDGVFHFTKKCSLVIQKKIVF